MNTARVSLFRRLLWALTLGVGFGTVWGVVGAWLYSAVESVQRQAENEAMLWEQLVVRSDGTPLIMSAPRTDLSLATYRDLRGAIVDSPDSAHLLPSVTVSGAHDEPGFFSSEPNWGQRLKFFVNDVEPTVHWFFVHDGKPDGAGYFAGYEEVSNRRVGYIGLAGFRTDPLPVGEWIPVRGPLVTDYSQWSSVPTSIYSVSGSSVRSLRARQEDLPPHRAYVPSGNRLRVADLARRTLQTVFETPEPIAAIGVSLLSTFRTSGLEPQDFLQERPIVVRTERQIFSLNHDHKIIRAFTIPDEVDRRSAASWYEIGGGQAVVAFRGLGARQHGESQEKWTIYQIASDGTITGPQQAFLQNGVSVMNDRMGGLVMTILLPVPALVVVLQPLLLEDAPRYPSYAAAFAGMIRTSWPSLVLLCAIAMVLTIATYRRCRSFGLSPRETLVWSVLVFMFGLPAYAGLRLGRHWPVRPACPHCDARTPRDRTACAACGVPLPAPALTGIEIFA